MTDINQDPPGGGRQMSLRRLVVDLAGRSPWHDAVPLPSRLIQRRRPASVDQAASAARVDDVVEIANRPVGRRRSVVPGVHSSTAPSRAKSSPALGVRAGEPSSRLIRPVMPKLMMPKLIARGSSVVPVEERAAGVWAGEGKRPSRGLLPGRARGEIGEVAIQAVSRRAGASPPGRGFRGISDRPATRRLVATAGKVGLDPEVVRGKTEQAVGSSSSERMGWGEGIPSHIVGGKADGLGSKTIPTITRVTASRGPGRDGQDKQGKAYRTDLGGIADWITPGGRTAGRVAEASSGDGSTGGSANAMMSGRESFSGSGGGSGSITLNGNIVLDGREIGTIVAGSLLREAGRPSSGTTRFNPSSLPTFATTRIPR